MRQKTEGKFCFKGLPAGADFAGLAREATGLEISPTWQLGSGRDAEAAVTSTDQAEHWSVYLRLVRGEARLLHDARGMAGAAHALVAADRGCGFPVSLEAWDMRCEADSLRVFPEALRQDVQRAVVFRLQDSHAGFALAAWIDLARHQAAHRRDRAAGR